VVIYLPDVARRCADTGLRAAHRRQSARWLTETVTVNCIVGTEMR
jgi:hypothetical protein